MTELVLKNIIILTLNFTPESVGGATRIYEMAKLLSRYYNVTVVCPAIKVKVSSAEAILS